MTQQNSSPGMANYSDLSEREIELLKNQPPYSRMKSEHDELMAASGSNPRKWQGREIRNDMLTTEPAESDHAKAILELHEGLNENALKKYSKRSEFEMPPYEPPAPRFIEFNDTDRAIFGLSRVFDNLVEGMIDPEPVRPTPGTVKKSLDAQKRNQAEADRRRRQREYVHRAGLTHRPFRAALADFNRTNKEQ